MARRILRTRSLVCIHLSNLWPTALNAKKNAPKAIKTNNMEGKNQNMSET